MTVNIYDKTGYTLVGQDITDPVSHGLQVKRSTGTRLIDLNIHDCAMSGIRDFATGTTIIDCRIVHNGHDGVAYNGDGILVQGTGTIISGGYIEGNGDHATFEHGIYLAGPARNYLIRNLTLKGNSASGIKADGGGRIENVTISGSVRGIAFAGAQPVPIVVRNATIQANTYAVIADSTTNIARIDSDYNIYAKGSRFNWSGHGQYDLAGWIKATGLDKHSVYA